MALVHDGKSNPRVTSNCGERTFICYNRTFFKRASAELGDYRRKHLQRVSALYYWQLECAGPVPIAGVPVMSMMAPSDRLAYAVFMVVKDQYLTLPEAFGSAGALPTARLA